ncbi:thiaminase II [Enterococcus sp. AZ194]|uniref:thiaminase II n=1 Tax=Enterococcus sp. AZ194 TaxID=2774629 RepID=UPI003F29AC27
MFTEKIRKKAEPIWQKSMQHPFIKELQRGELAEDKFRFYLIQDHFYLNAFTEIHKLAAECADNPEIKELFLNNIAGIEVSEVSVRETFFKELAITEEEIQQTMVAPAAYHYIAHMYKEAQSKSVGRIVAALLPCYWLYQEIGEELILNGSPTPLYQRWIETYDSEAYKTTVEAQKNLTNRLAAVASEDEVQLMEQAFLISSYEELYFWEMGYQKEEWSNKHVSLPIS